LSLGLASHRLGDDRVATAAFDSATLFMTPGERGRLDRFERLLRPEDSTTVVQLSDSARAAAGNIYWRAVDQLWSRPEEKPRTEFLARVAYAELRWTVDEMLARGADTDRGNIYIRYGPPDIQVTQKDGGVASDLTTVWGYDYSRLWFAFIGMPTFSTSYFVSPWQVAQVVDSMPARWDNISSVRVDSMPVGVTRFRAGGDTAEVVLAAWPEVERIGNAADLRTAVRSDAWLLRANLDEVWHDSVLAARAGTRSWRQRMGVGDYIFRTEATAETARLAARSVTPLRIREEPGGFAFRGFGMSDLLMADEPTDVLDAARWDGLGVTPIAPRVVGGRFALVWEAYELGAREGSAEYEVTITIRPVEGRLARIVANTFGRLGVPVGVSRGTDRVDVRYTRRVAHRETLVEQVGLNLAGTPAGEYELTLELRDQVTRQRTSRTLRFAIVEPPRR
jgi:GWxTD domain-containing protein